VGAVPAALAGAGEAVRGVESLAHPASRNVVVAAVATAR